MKRVARLLGFLGLVCLLASCGKRSFITDTSYRQRVEQDFNQKKKKGCRRAICLPYSIRT